MLTQLNITNYAIIDNLNVALNDGFTVITGETGAGKSILLGALSLIMGKRADTSVLYDKERKCIVEAEFAVDNSLKPFFEENDLDFESRTIIRREITSAGKSRGFINDTPANLGVLKQLSQQLIDIHSQHETLNLSSSQYQLNVVDQYAQQATLVNEYKKEFYLYNQLKEQLEILQEQEKQSNLDKDYFQFQFDELDEANLEQGEQEELEGELKMLEHAEQIKSTLFEVNGLLSDENAGVDILQQAKNRLATISGMNSNLETLIERLDSVYIELTDIANEIESTNDKLDLDAEKQQEITERLDLIYKLQQKHRVDSIEELAEIKKELEEKLVGSDNLQHQIEAQVIAVEKQLNHVKQLAEQLSQKRLSVLRNIKADVEKILQVVGMKDAKLDIERNEVPLNDKGKDHISIQFTANKGIASQEIGKVASGGELSRLMLALKTVLSAKSNLPTIIFDEIDTGVSGEIADKMAAVMKKLSDNTQVISITHLPQIAGKGSSHYVVYKTVVDDRTISNMRQLDAAQRVEEIAKMLSGERLTQAALDNANELLN